MKLVDAYVPNPAAVIAVRQAEQSKTYKSRVPILDKKLLKDLQDIFAGYNPATHIVGVKSTHDVKEGFKDKHTRTVVYVAGNVVKDPKAFNKNAVCGGGLHFSFAHDATSMRGTLVHKTEVGARFHIALADVKEAVVVEGNKFKVPKADIVFTGSFADCHRLLNALFGNLGYAKDTVAAK